MGNWNLARLRAMSMQERHRLWLNAKAKVEASDEAKNLVELIESSGLEYGKDKVKSVSLDDSTGRTLKRIIGSDAGIAAMRQATEEGLPALAGVEPLLQAELGDMYSKHNEATVQAGYLVKGFMEGLGYKAVRSSPMPDHCVAKTALVFASRKDQ